MLKSSWTVSTIGNVLFVIALGMSFGWTKPTPPSLTVDTITSEQFSELSQAMAGNKNAPKGETPKPQADKIEEPKVINEPVPKVVEKPEVKPIPKEAPAEQTPPEPKPEQVVKEQIKPPQPKPDPIVEALKKEDAKKAAEAKAKAKAATNKKPQPAFNPDQIAALLDKRDPQRQAATSDTINQNPTLGTSTGSASTLSQSEVDALRARLAQLWNPPAGALNPQDLVVKVRIKLGRDGKLAGPPLVMTSGQGNIFEAARDGAVRALFQAQPYEMLRPDHYDLWKEMEITFDPREMIRG
jgi:hypothetical protein